MAGESNNSMTIPDRPMPSLYAIAVRLLLQSMALIFVTACAAQVETQGMDRARLFQPADAKARIVFFRTRDSALYLARKASVSVNDEKVGATAYGRFFYIDVEPGNHRLRTDMWDAPGQCELDLAAAEGRTYYFQVDPRNESFGAFSISGFAAGMVSGGVLADLAGGLAGSAAESYGKQCGGAFKLYPVDDETAHAKIADLAFSRSKYAPQ